MYSIEFGKKAVKQFSKLDKIAQKLILSGLEKIEKSNDPRAHGKALKGQLKTYWRYRVGKYRLITFIEDEKLIITVIEVGHRKDIYL